jgi:glycosyltransferase involved in cell wall biosynthesis
MTIAGICTDPTDGLGGTGDLVFFERFLHDFSVHAPEACAYHVFLPPNTTAAEHLPWGPHVVRQSVLELPGFVRETRIDVWHDLGYPDQTAAEQTRRLGRQGFPITTLCTPSRLIDLSEGNGRRWGSWDAVVCLSQDGEARVRSELARTVLAPKSGVGTPVVCTIPLGAEPRVATAGQREDARRLLEIPQGDTLILCLGDMAPQSGLDPLPLVRAFEPLLQEEKSLRLVIAGPDRHGFALPLAQILSDFPSRRRVLLWPKVSSTARELLLSAADVFVSPVDVVTTESVLDLTDAMAHGLPVIVSNGLARTVGLAEDEEALVIRTVPLAPGENPYYDFSFVLPAELRAMIAAQGTVVDAEQLARHLRTVIRDRPLRAALGAATVAHVGRNRTPCQTIDAYCSLWSSLAARAGAPMDVAVLPPGSSRSTPPGRSHDQVEITPYGAECLASKRPFLYDPMRDALSPPIILEILALARRPVSTESVLDALCSLAPTEEDEALKTHLYYHLCWCLKHALLRLTGSAGTPTTGRS